jgi:pimeloyl-ACP methyl ester carboxylesterase/DNA-binding winged helix-turn-helix (wHTH) protein
MIYEFGDFVLDTRRCELTCAGEPRHLEPQVYAVLCHLIEHRERVVGRDELLDQVWGHRFVTPGTLDTRIKHLRQALGDDGDAQQMIRTVRGRGFRFVCEVRVRSGDATAAVKPPSAAVSTAINTALTRFDVAAPKPRQRIRFCRAKDGVRIAYAVSGGGPPLVRPANWLTHLEYDWESPVWGHWLRALGRTHTVIRYDARGCGLSDHDVPEFSFDAWVTDLEAVVDALGLERFSLLGISQGCAVAIAYAVRHPERVASLVLHGGYARGRNHRERDRQREVEGTLLRDLIRDGWGRDHEAFRQVFGALFVPGGTLEQMRWFADLTRTVPLENALRISETAHNIDIRELAPSLTVPALVLHSRGDAMVPFEEGRQLAARIPDVRFVPLDSQNHVLLEHEPAWARFLEEVRAFLGVSEERREGT